MNLVAIEVRVKSIQIKTPPSHQIAFSLRLGTVLSSLSHSYPNPSPDINADLLLTCDEAPTASNSRVRLPLFIGLLSHLFRGQHH